MGLYKHLKEALREPKYWLPAPPPAPPIPMWVSNLIWDIIVPETSVAERERLAQKKGKSR